MLKLEEMIEVTVKTPNGKILKNKKNIRISRCFYTKNPDEIGFLCAYKDELTLSFAKSVAARHGDDGTIIKVEELEIGQNEYAVLIGNKESEKQLIRAVEDFDRMLRDGNIIKRAGIEL